MSTRSPSGRRRALRVSGAVVASVLGAYVLTYLGYALYLLVLADEGSLPPRSRIPEVPAGVQVVSEAEQCGSGGCWRELVLRPPAGRTPDELAAEMDLLDARREGWRWNDPHSVEIGALAVGRDLRLSVGY